MLPEVQLVPEGLYQLWNFAVVVFPGEQWVLLLPRWQASHGAVRKGPLEVPEGP